MFGIIEIIKYLFRGLKAMFKVVIKTETPEWCLIKKHNFSTILFKQIWLDKKNDIKALINYKTKNKNVSVLIRNHRCPLAEAILSSGAIVVSAEVKLNEIIWILACTQDELKKLIENLEKSEFNYELIWKSKFFEEDNEISQREREILLLALKFGYFETPKRIKLEEIAKSLGISKSTASELLRRALKKVIKKFVLEGLLF